MRIPSLYLADGKGVRYGFNGEVWSRVFNARWDERYKIRERYWCNWCIRYVHAKIRADAAPMYPKKGATCKLRDVWVGFSPHAIGYNSPTLHSYLVAIPHYFRWHFAIIYETYSSCGKERVIFLLAPKTETTQKFSCCALEKFSD